MIAPFSSLNANILPPFPSSINSGFMPLIFAIAWSNKTFVALSGNPALNFNPAVAVCNAVSTRMPNTSFVWVCSAWSYFVLRSLYWVVTLCKSAFACFNAFAVSASVAPSAMAFSKRAFSLVRLSICDCRPFAPSTLVLNSVNTRLA